jgi:hypothetical protein
MKSIWKGALILGASLIVLQATAHTMAQDTPKMSTKIKRGVKKAANKTAKVAVKAESAVADKIYEGKAGPDGATVYITKTDHYYYVNGKGAKVPIKKSQLHDKPST